MFFLLVSVFQCQFDRMWKAASKKVTKGSKRARTGTETEQMQEVEASGSEELSSEKEPGKKRKHGKRTCFPSTLALLELLGL